MSLLNVGSRALLTNQIALQTTGHNIANVSTPGYSRQTAHLVTVPGQQLPQGYVGMGVAVETILRNHNELLTRQAAMANAASASDVARSNSLNQLQEIFTGGKDSLGMAIADMLGSLSDVANAANDMTARSVVLARMSETAARFRTAADRMYDIEFAVNEQLKSDMEKINSLTKSIAAINEQVVAARGSGHSPNDLLDTRDTLIRDLNQYIQTSQVPASDGSISLFVASSQPLVLGSQATQLAIQTSLEFPGSNQQALYFMRPNGSPIELNPNMLGGGEVAGLLRFANNDLAEARGLLGRIAQAMAMTMNEQHKLGLTLDRQLGKDLFAVPTEAQGYTTIASAIGSTVEFVSPTEFAASDYEVRFNDTGNAGYVVRLSDGKTTAFNVSTPSDPALDNIDGLKFNLTGSAPSGRILFKPFADSAANLQSLVLSPNDLAAANWANAAMGTSNGGSMELVSLKATGVPTPIPPATTVASVTLTFDGQGGFDVAGAVNPPVDLSTTPPTPLAGPPYNYVPGKPIGIDDWQITLSGMPNNGDTVTIGDARDPQFGDYYKRDAGNAGALMALRDVQMFDNSTLQDGWSTAIAQVGTRTQSAQYAANMSYTIAQNLERDRVAVSGVNLDEEAARLIQYQQAYQASAKMIQVAQSIFDSLLSATGR